MAEVDEVVGALPVRRTGALPTVRFCLFVLLAALTWGFVVCNRAADHDPSRSVQAVWLQHFDHYSLDYSGRVAPALDSAIAGDAVEVESLYFYGPPSMRPAGTVHFEENSALDAADGSTLDRKFLLPAGDSNFVFWSPDQVEVVNLALDWDGEMEAAIGDGQIDRDALESMREHDVGAQLVALEKASFPAMRHRYDDVRRHHLIMSVARWALLVLIALDVLVYVLASRWFPRRAS